ncbi:hypothetical protein GCM10011366_24900 [Ornithinimicrobium tianjinense]|uniref:Uncharacterized protein n=1 Tax=Ornithinimicrobium tianjinense TaxID=1195761 RepID=A0A917BTR7_9MICO|nr:hypothetical protein GCM10011366_24900 [Ornithinimicrobium tianjinense]
MAEGSARPVEELVVLGPGPQHVAVEVADGGAPQDGPGHPFVGPGTPVDEQRAPGLGVPAPRRGEHLRPRGGRHTVPDQDQGDPLPALVRPLKHAQRVGGADLAAHAVGRGEAARQLRLGAPQPGGVVLYDQEQGSGSPLVTGNDPA